MITVSEAEAHIQKVGLTLKEEALTLDKAIGRILANPIVADRNFPPYDRVMMDGIALRHVAWEKGQRTFQITGTQMAGMPPMQLERETDCIEIMTGAVCPEGADTILRYEDLKIDDMQEARTATVEIDEVRLGQNIHPEGSDRIAGDVLVQAGHMLAAAEIAIAATVGMDTLSVYAPPRVGICSSGDELVAIDQTPLPHQIRRSNSHMLQAALRDMGIPSTILHVSDDPNLLREKVSELLKDNDILIFSGGVSMGKADHIPQVLESLGVKKEFHRVSQRPGKPFWFGVKAQSEKVVFGLPGNPVSSMVGFYRYIKPWLLKQMHLNHVPILYAQLSESYTFLPPLTCFLLVETYMDKSGVRLAKPVPGSGSGDLANLTRCDGFIELPAQRNHFDRGESFRLTLIR